MAWKKAKSSGSGTSWDYHNQPVVEGVYCGKEENVGRNGSTIYHLTTDAGADVGVWDTALLRDRFAMVQEGWKVRIEFLGKATGKGGRQYNNFDFQYDDGVEVEDDGTPDFMKD